MTGLRDAGELLRSRLDLADLAKAPRTAAASREQRRRAYTSPRRACRSTSIGTGSRGRAGVGTPGSIRAPSGAELAVLEAVGEAQSSRVHR